MQLNLPILHLLENSENILIAGAGGGFDVFAGLPIYFTLREMGKRVHLANFSFTPVELVATVCDTITLAPNELEGARADMPDWFQTGYYPEGYLSRWFKETQNEDVTIWMFARNGAVQLTALYQQLQQHLGFDALIMIDGGIDSVMRGDEEGTGTLVEDTISMAAIRSLDVPVKVLACLGFGAELEVSHYNALDNMARLIKEGAFYGSCALTRQMPVYDLYEQACRYVWEQPDHHKSHINMRVVSATQGEFGNHHLYTDYRPIEVFVSPLMSLYWFFDADKVVDSSYIAKGIAQSTSMEHAFKITTHYMYHKKNQRRSRSIPY